MTLDCLNLLRFAGSITKLLESGGMPLEDIPAFQEQMRLDITSASMRVYHPRESDKILERYREFWPQVQLHTRTELSSV